MKVLITGATGLVGSTLTKLVVSKGHSVNYLSISKKKLSDDPNYKGFFWNPQLSDIDENAFLGVDAVIHLAGASISKRWTKKYKNEILESRVNSANLLLEVVMRNRGQVKHFISASATGIYPSSLGEVYFETSKSSDKGFLGSVVSRWEESADKFSKLGIKVCKLRTGLVLSEKGGALPELMKPIQLGLGSAFGSGRQIQSWIHINDLCSMYLFALEHSLTGTYNAVAPNPVTNAELTKAVAGILDKPLFLPKVPKFAMKLLLGEMHQLLFDSQNVSPEKILKSGFTFRFIDVNSAIKNLLT